MPGDDTTDPLRSALTLYEDGRELGPPHASHSEIRVLGAGRYSHWNTELYFSASDNSDPNSNSREYRFEISRDRYFERRAEMAAAIVSFYATHLEGGAQAFAGKQALEIGPGRDMGTALLMAGLGANVSCLEKYGGGWQAGWHAPFVERLLALLPSLPWEVDPGPLERSLRADAFDPESITVIDAALEELPERYADWADIFVSHSVLEHFESPVQAIPRLRMACRPAAVGVHRIDFRDHREMQKPLEFLLLDDAAFEAAAGNYRYGCGNRMRLPEYQALLQAHFRSAEFIEETAIDEGYLSDFLPRLRAAGTRFSDAPIDALRPIGGVFRIRCGD
jgi:hypothetical protein